MDTLHLKAKLDFLVFHGHSPDMNKIFRFWYEIYIEEMGLNVMQGVDDQKKELTEDTDGSEIFTILQNDTVIGTLKATFNQRKKLSFNYEKHLGKKRIVETSKFMISKEHRASTAAVTLLAKTYQHLCALYNPEVFVLNCTNKLMGYYRKFGFRLLVEEEVVHPVIGNKSYLLYVTRHDLHQAITGMAAKMLK